MSTTTATKKPFRCRIGMHHYVLRVNDAGERFHECEYCGHFDPRSSSTGGGGMMIG